MESYVLIRIPSRLSIRSRTRWERVPPLLLFRSALASPPRILFLFCGRFLFFYFVWWWRARSGFSKGETDGILSANSVDSVLPNYFLGIWIWQNRDCVSRPQKGVWGMNAGGFVSDFSATKMKSTLTFMVDQKSFSFSNFVYIAYQLFSQNLWLKFSPFIFNCHSSKRQVYEWRNVHQFYNPF